MNPAQMTMQTPSTASPVVLAVGEINPFGSRPDMALWCEPRESSGNRLRRIMGLTDEQYVATVARVNLCDGPRWDKKSARERFWDGVDFDRYALVVLLGQKVRAAVMGPPIFQVARGVGNCHFTSIPHPSGRCRMWNDPGVVALARAALQRGAPGVPWGTAGDAL